METREAKWEELESCFKVHEALTERAKKLARAGKTAEAGLLFAEAMGNWKRGHELAAELGA